MPAVVCYLKKRNNKTVNKSFSSYNYGPRSKKRKQSQILRKIQVLCYQLMLVVKIRQPVINQINRYPWLQGVPRLATHPDHSLVNPLVPKPGLALNQNQIQGHRFGNSGSQPTNRNQSHQPLHLHQKRAVSPHYPSSLPERGTTVWTHPQGTSPSPQAGRPVLTAMVEYFT